MQNKAKITLFLILLLIGNNVGAATDRGIPVGGKAKERVSLW